MEATALRARSDPSSRSRRALRPQALLFPLLPFLYPRFCPIYIFFKIIYTYDYHLSFDPNLLFFVAPKPISSEDDASSELTDSPIVPRQPTAATSFTPLSRSNPPPGSSKPVNDPNIPSMSSSGTIYAPPKVFFAAASGTVMNSSSSVPALLPPQEGIFLSIHKILCLY